MTADTFFSVAAAFCRADPRENFDQAPPIGRLLAGIPRLVFLIAALTLFLPKPSLAANPGQGAKAAGMATAFAAVADDPSAMSHNPAGLTQLSGTNIYAGATAVMPTTKFTSPSGETEETEFQVFFPPHLYVSSDFELERLVFGLGISSPFGIGGRKWDDTGLTRYWSVESTIATISANPTVAWRITQDVSIGFGVNYMWSFNEAEKKLDQSAVGAGDGKLRLDADGGGWGYNLGILLFPGKKVSLGFAYRSAIEIDQEGTATIEDIAPALQPMFGGSSFETDISTTVDFPEIVDFAVAFRPNNKLTVSFGAEWTGWSSFNNQFLDVKNEIPQAGFSDSIMALDWDDTWLLKVGAEYKVSERLALRGGYAFVENWIPNHTLSPAAPESNQHNFVLGLGVKAGYGTIDVFSNAGFYEDRQVDNTILSGTYENFCYSLGFSWGYRF